MDIKNRPPVRAVFAGWLQVDFYGVFVLQIGELLHKPFCLRRFFRHIKKDIFRLDIGQVCED